MSQTPIYFTKILEEQLAQLAEKIPAGEEVIVSQRRIKLRKNNQEEDLQITSRQHSPEIEEYLAEFRTPMDEIELPEVEGTAKERSKMILIKLRSRKNNRTFEYYYLLGKLLKEYPTIVKKEIHKEYEYDRNKSQKLINLIRKTATLFDAVGTSYLKVKKLHPTKLRKMKEEIFDELMTRIGSIVATRLNASSLLLDELLGDLNFPVSQELNANAGVMLPEFEFDPNSTINDPEIPE